MFKFISQNLFGKEGGVSQEEMKKTVSRESFSKFFPWLAFDPEDSSFINTDHTSGYLWECDPVAFAGLKDLQTLEAIFRLEFPKETVFQMILYADPDISRFIEAFKRGKERPGELTKRNIDEYAEFLRQGVKGVKQLHNIPLRNFRCFVALKSPSKIDRDDIAVIDEALVGVGMNPRRMEAEELIVLMRGLFNRHQPENISSYDLNIPIRKQILFAETNIIDKKGHLEIGSEATGITYARCLTPKNLPKEVDSLSTNALTGGIMGVMDDTTQITSPFLWSLNVLFDDGLKANIHNKATVTMMQQATGSFAVQVKKRNEELTWALNEMESQKFVRAIPSLWIFADSEEEARIATARARRIWEGQNYVMQEETLLRRAMLIASLPFGLYTNKETIKVLDRDFPLPANVVTRLMPFQADFAGSRHNPVLCFIGRKGQVAGIDVFDERSNNHNFLVTAGSGAGKSFNLNALLANYYAANSMVRVVDLGYSYQKLCHTVGGRFMDFGKEKVTINPFTSSAKDEEDRKFDHAATTNILGEMVYSASDSHLDETEWTLLKEAVNYAMKEDPINGIDAVAKYLAEFPKQADEDMKEFEGVGKEKAKRMAFNLRDFKKNGRFGDFFNGESTFNIAQDDFVVLELERLKPQKELFRVITMQVLNAITQDLYWSDRGSPRFILFEEAWSFFGSGDRIGLLIQEGYRRARKYHGSFGIVTQSLLDLEKFGDSGDVIRANAAFKFLMESGDYREAADKKLIDYEGLALDLVSSIKNNKPRYSEIFLDTPFGKGPGRLVVDPWTYWVATSAGNDVKKFMDLLNQGHDVVSVLEYLTGKEKKLG